MTIEVIFGVVQAIVTAIAGIIFKKTQIPNKYIPIQNMVIGILAGILAYYFRVYDNIGISLMLCLATSLGVGGLYDATQISSKEE